MKKDIIMSPFNNEQRYILTHGLFHLTYIIKPIKNNAAHIPLMIKNVGRLIFDEVGTTKKQSSFIRYDN